MKIEEREKYVKQLKKSVKSQQGPTEYELPSKN